MKEFIRGSVTTKSGNMMVAIKDKDKVYYASINEDRKQVTGVVMVKGEDFDGWIDHSVFSQKGIDSIKVFKYLEEFATTGTHPYASNVELNRLF